VTFKTVSLCKVLISRCGHRGSPQRGTGSAAGVNWNLVRQGVVTPNSYTVISASKLHRQCWLAAWISAAVISILNVFSRRYSIIKQAAYLSHLLDIFLSPAPSFITWISGAFPTLSNCNILVVCGLELCECYYVNVTVWVLLCECYCVNVTVWMLLCERYCLNVTVWTLLCECYCVNVTVWMLLCERYCVHVTVWMLLCECYCVNVTVWTLLCECYCVNVTVWMSRNDRRGTFLFICVPCIFNNVTVLLPTNAPFIRHIKC
jgi:hypothetical protein